MAVDENKISYNIEENSGFPLYVIGYPINNVNYDLIKSDIVPAVNKLFDDDIKYYVVRKNQYKIFDLEKHVKDQFPRYFEYKGDNRVFLDKLNGYCGVFGITPNISKNLLLEIIDPFEQINIPDLFRQLEEEFPELGKPKICIIGHNDSLC
jgi:hypothetical protein